MIMGGLVSQRIMSREDIRPGKKAMVIGLGKSGAAAARLLAANGVQVTVSESASQETLGFQLVKEMTGLGITLETGGHNHTETGEIDFLVVSPGVPLDMSLVQEAQHKGLPVIGEFGLAALFLKTACVAVTGTNGKSTVTDLIGRMFKAAGKEVFVGGNIGVPLSEYVMSSQESEMAVLEVSSFQLDTANYFQPEVAVLLNISPDHLDRYVAFEAYAASKLSIFKNQKGGDAAVFNFDDAEVFKHVAESKEEIPGRCYFFSEKYGRRSGAYLDGDEVVLSGLKERGEERYDLAINNFTREPNRHNAMAAILAARLADCPPSGVKKGLADFVSLPHRLAQVAEIGGVSYLDDSKATNVGAVIAALESIDRPVVLIAGGRDKEGGYGALAKAARQKVKAVVLIGESKKRIAVALNSVARLHEAESIQGAVALAAELAQPGDVVLLSPACASFDMFESYVHRGEEFRNAVRLLKGQGLAKGGISGQGE